MLFKTGLFPIVKNMNERGKEGEKKERRTGREGKEKEGTHVGHLRMPSLRFLVRAASVSPGKPTLTAPPLPVQEVPVPPLIQHLSQQVNLGHILLKSLRSPRLPPGSGVDFPLSPWFWGREECPKEGTGTRGFPRPYVGSPGVGGLGNPVPLRAWGFCTFISGNLLYFRKREMRSKTLGPQHHQPPFLSSFR